MLTLVLDGFVRRSEVFSGAVNEDTTLASMRPGRAGGRAGGDGHRHRGQHRWALPLFGGASAPAAWRRPSRPARPSTRRSTAARRASTPRRGRRRSRALRSASRFEGETLHDGLAAHPQKAGSGSASAGSSKGAAAPITTSRSSPTKTAQTPSPGNPAPCSPIPASIACAPMTGTRRRSGARPHRCRGHLPIAQVRTRTATHLPPHTNPTAICSSPSSPTRSHTPTPRRKGRTRKRGLPSSKDSSASPQPSCERCTLHVRKTTRAEQLEIYRALDPAPGGVREMIV